MKIDWRQCAAVALALAALKAAADAPGYGPVGNETLWTVAGKVSKERHLGTTAQLAWALFRANPDAFDGTPDKLKPGAMLKVPGADAVTAVSNAEAYEKLTGKQTARAAGTQATAPAKPHEPPAIAGVELKPAANGRQWFGIVGSGFRPGVKLDLRDLLGDAKFLAQAPSKISPTRIDYLARVGATPSNWLLTVRNADGTQSEPYGLSAGPGVTSAAPARTEAERDAEEQADSLKREAESLAAEKAAMDKAAADKAALDREFEQKMAADKAAYEKAEAARKKKKKR